MMTELLLKLYNNPSSPASFSGVNKLYKEAHKLDPSIKLKDVKDFLSNNLVYQLHKPIRKRFKRNPIVAEYINENFQADLVDMKEFKKDNQNFSFILTVVDVLSKKAWAKPLKTKSASVVTQAFEEILQNVVPIKLQTDNGKEFINSNFKQLMKKYKINHFTTNNKDIKCAIIERFNKTLKDKMFEYFTSIGKYKYIDVLDGFINSYNNTYHRSIKMSPNEVNENNVKNVFKNLYGVNSKRDLLKARLKPKLNIKDKVRVKYDSKPLDRGYYPNWSDDVFTIENKLSQINKPLYTLKNSEGIVKKRRFYPEEIQKITNADLSRISRPLKQKIINGEKYYLVEWINQNKRTWIKASEAFDINGT